jgi:hypothetical protein
MSGSIGEGIEDILNIGQGRGIFIQHLYHQRPRDSVPTIVAFTKFDQPGALGSSARERACTHFEQSCHSLFHKKSSDVPAEMVSGNCSFFYGTVL